MKDIDKTKRKFEDALFTLLKNKNYHDITINEICALANKTKMTFYHYFKDKDNLLAIASINLINREYDDDYAKILKKESDLEEIEYQSLIVTFNWVSKHYDQIQNLIYKGETLPLEIFKKALYDNYHKYITESISTSGFDIPSDYISIFCFEGLYGTCLYYGEKIKKGESKKKTKEEMKKVCRLLANAVISIST